MEVKTNKPENSQSRSLQLLEGNLEKKKKIVKSGYDGLYIIMI